MDIKILYEDKYIIVAVKPPKVPSQADKTGDEDMVTALEKHVGGYIGLIHRLDRPVGGIMVFAKNKESTSILSRAVSSNNIRKKYFAVVCGEPSEQEGEFRDFLIKNQKLNMSKVVPDRTNGAKEAVLEYSVLGSIKTEEFGILSLVEINLITGRHHQIRVQFSNNNTPLWGDNKYNEEFKKRRGWTQIALWSGVLEFKHPKTNKVLRFEEKPQEFPFELFSQLKG